MIILFRPGLHVENNLVANAVIKLNVTVAACLISKLFDSYVKKSETKHKKQKQKKKKEKNEEM